GSPLTSTPSRFSSVTLRTGLRLRRRALLIARFRVMVNSQVDSFSGNRYVGAKRKARRKTSCPIDSTSSTLPSIRYRYDSTEALYRSYRRENACRSPRWARRMRSSSLDRPSAAGLSSSISPAFLGGGDLLLR